MLLVITRTLADYHVSTARDATEAMAILSARDPIDLLITDYLMPGMRGSELAEEVGKLRPGLPVLLLTGYAHLAKGEAVGIRRLAKPFREADLAREVADLLKDDTPADRRKLLKSVN